MSKSPAKTTALGLALVGTALTVGPEGGQFLGVLLRSRRAAIYSVYIMVGAQVMKQVSAVQSSTVIFASAGGMSGVLMMGMGRICRRRGRLGRHRLNRAGCDCAARRGFLAGLERIGPTNAAMLSTLEPVVTVLLAAMLLGETLKPITLLGGGLILVAVCCSRIAN